MSDFCPIRTFIPALSNQTGLEPEVSDYVLSQPDAQTFVAKAEALIEFYLPRAQREGSPT